MAPIPEIRLRLSMQTELIREFFPLLQQGVVMTARVGCSLRKLLVEQFGLDRDYVTGRITTLFLDHRPIDDLDATIVQDGATLALSGAMPGLVGATMRRGGFYAAFRDGISHAGNSGPASVDRIGTVRVKLFNLLLAEVGPGFLRRGIVVPAAELAAFLGGKTDPFWRGCHEALLNDTPVGPEFLFSGEPFIDVENVRLTVHFRG